MLLLIAWAKRAKSFGAVIAKQATNSKQQQATENIRNHVNIVERKTDSGLTALSAQ